MIKSSLFWFPAPVGIIINVLFICLFFFLISRRHLKTFKQVPRLQQQQQKKNKRNERKEKNSHIAKYTITNKTQTRATHRFQAKYSYFSFFLFIYFFFYFLLVSQLRFSLNVARFCKQLELHMYV